MTKTFNATGNYGTLICDAATGNVVRYEREGDYRKQGDGYDSIVRLDVAKWRATYPHGKLCACHDILDFGLWDSNGHYDKPETDWRK